MKTNVIQIGNSKGLRLSKTILEKYEIGDSVEIILEHDHIKLVPITNPRKDWDKAFQKMHRNDDDKLMMDDIFKDEQHPEWE